jgi:hypothetical protein
MTLTDDLLGGVFLPGRGDLAEVIVIAAKGDARTARIFRSIRIAPTSRIRSHVTFCCPDWNPNRIGCLVISFVTSVAPQNLIRSLASITQRN